MVDLSGLIVTKLDGTAKGGVVVALARRFGLPIHAIGVGETIDDLRPFEADAFARALLGLEPRAGRLSSAMAAGKARAMPRNIVETVLGAAVLAVAHRLPRLGLWPQRRRRSRRLHAEGQVRPGRRARHRRRRAHLRHQGRPGGGPGSSIPQTYRAQVTFSVRNGIELPSDSSAAIVSSGLLGGKYLSLVPGGDDRLLKDGDEITLTQSSVNLEDLIGRYIFSGQRRSTGRQAQ